MPTNLLCKNSRVLLASFPNTGLASLACFEIIECSVKPVIGEWVPGPGLLCLKATEGYDEKVLLGMVNLSFPGWITVDIGVLITD